MTETTLVEEIFVPAHPVTGLTYARRDESELLSDYLNEPGSQILIYGQSGVGKTSLALNSLLDSHNWIRIQCDSDTKIESVYSSISNALLDPVPIEVEKLTSTETKLSLGLRSHSFAKDYRGSFRELYKNEQSHSASSFVSSLSPEAWKILIDDYERISDIRTKTAIAELAKSFSDQATKVKLGGSVTSAKLVIVGIGETMEDLLAGDRSNRGRIMSIHLEPLSDEQVRSFLIKGFEHLKIGYAQTALNSFVTLAAGYPRYAHALALEACRLASRTGHSRRVTDEIAAKAVYKTLKRYEPNFQQTYNWATRSRANSKRIHLKLVQAIANIRKVECNVDEILLAMRELDPTLEHQSITPALGSLTSENRGRVLRRPMEQRGIYTFTDPLFKSYVRMKHFRIQVSADMD